MNWDGWDPRVKKWLPLFRVVDRLVEEASAYGSGRVGISDSLFRYRIGRMTSELMQGSSSHLDEIKTASRWETVGVLLLLLSLMPGILVWALIGRSRKKLGGR